MWKEHVHDHVIGTTDRSKAVVRNEMEGDRGSRPTIVPIKLQCWGSEMNATFETLHLVEGLVHEDSFFCNGKTGREAHRTINVVADVWCTTSSIDVFGIKTEAPWDLTLTATAFEYHTQV